MEKQIKDYLHLYLGCKVKLVKDISEEFSSYDDFEVPAVESIGTFCMLNDGFQVYCGDESEEWPYGVKFDHNFIASWDFKSYKPILRPLSSMTGIEQEDYEAVNGGGRFKAHPNAEAYRWLVSKHFDLFGLIESGLAIDATTLTQPQT